MLETNLGLPAEKSKIYFENSAVKLSDKRQNVAALKEIKIQFYTEPDSSWWKKNRGVEYEQTNAYLLEQAAQLLKQKGFDKISLIQTKNKGYRRDKMRHPHSWSIVDGKEFVKWVKK